MSLDVLELLYWFVGTIGVVLSAQGMWGLFGRQSAKVAGTLTNPLGRFDFLWSEGQFDLVLKWVEEDLTLSIGAVFLLASLVLSSAANICSVCDLRLECISCRVILRFAPLVVGVGAANLIKRCTEKIAVSLSAEEIERQARESIKRDPEPTKARKDIEQMLSNWFQRRVGRAPRLGP